MKRQFNNYAKGYYIDMLLHETMHLCGSHGANPIEEVINEYLTRKIAIKYNLRTNACGYPKEVKIVSKLAKLFGEEVINTLAFLNEKFDFIEKNLKRK